MLLTMDVGNTNITAGIFHGEKLLEIFRITTKLPRTSDEFGVLIKELLISKDIDPDKVQASVISSVVPNIMYSLTNSLIKYFHITPLIVGAGVKTGIDLKRLNPGEIGSDRIVDLVGAYNIYGGPVLVIDYGTATTYDLITEDGVFWAGATAPGIRTSANALWQEAARLPEIEIKKPDSVLATNTIESMQAGLVYGVIGQTKYIIEQMKRESGYEDLDVVATGGLGKIISDEVPEISVFDDTLTLKGLRLIYEMQK